MQMDVRIGTAGWSIPQDIAAEFPETGSGLERYSTRLTCAEINSSFHRSHRPSTWEKWRDSVPETFRFSVKVPKTITHQQRLVDTSELLDTFLREVARLGEKLAVLLVQLPPSLTFDPPVAETFFTDLTDRSAVRIACEPRHASWFEPAAEGLLTRFRVARVAADPARVPAAAQPGGWPGLRYWRLHGSPLMYRSSYLDRIEQYAGVIGAESGAAECWCIFDNTASSAAAGDALRLEAATRQRIRAS